MLMTQMRPEPATQGRTVPCYLYGAAVQLGEKLRDADSLEGLEEFFAAQGLPPDPQMLGLGRFHEAAEDEWELAIAAARQSLAMAGAEVDCVILCASRFRGETADHAAGMHRLLSGLGLTPAFTAGVTMNRCASFLSGLRLAEAMVVAGQSRTCLVVTADRFTSDAERLRPFALFSDGAAACIIGASPGAGPCYRILGSAAAVDSDAASESARISGAMVRQANAALHHVTGLSISDHAAVLPTNVYTPIVMMAEAQGGATPASLYLGNIVRRGHVFAADPLLNLVDFEAAESVATGTNLWLAATVPGLRVAMSLQKL
ncbi:MAG: hypothetical protein ACRCSU_09130 [Paracoccaceae bacterium]